MTRIDVRPSPIAGQWYEGHPSRLARNVDGYMEQAILPELPGEVIAVIAPHAGHIYSGRVAGYAFAPLRGKSFNVVAVVSPMHYPYIEPMLTSAHQAYQTPLGDVPVDHQALNELEGYLLAETGFGLARIANDSEHSLEIELPFLQRALKSSFRLIPIMLREQNVHVARAVGLSLARLFQDNASQWGDGMLLVASSDLSHFYPQPMAKKFDAEVLQRIEAFDPEGVIALEEQGLGFACGRGAIAAVLWAAQALGGDEVKVLHHATSGDVTGDYERVVGYGAAVVLRASKVS